MRIAPLGLAALVSISCGGRTPDREPAPPTTVAPHSLVGAWTLARDDDRRGGIRLELRVDSVARDSAYGRLTFYMAGDAGFLTPDDWGPLVGTMQGDAARLIVRAGARAPELELAGRTARDTVRLRTLRIGADHMAGPWILVRTTASRP